MARGRTTRTKYYPLLGGLDVVTPPLSVNPGKALAMVNYEPWYNGGYRRVPGFERFDGRPKPSAATYQGMQVDTVIGLSLGQAVTGSDSSETGEICGIWDDDGSFGFDAIGITKASGTFTAADTFAGGTNSVTNIPAVRYAPSNALDDIWLLEAQNNYRSDITAPAGSGAVRGTWQRGANNYAIRDDDSGPTDGILFLATASGWSTAGITMGFIVPFDAGLLDGEGLAEGDTLTNSTQVETATIHRIVLNAGSVAWDNDGIGYFVCTNKSGGATWGNNDILERDGANKIADQSAVGFTLALSPGGHYQFHNHNFFGSSDTYRTYACGGVDTFAIEIDENNIVSPIYMPDAADVTSPPTDLTADVPEGNPFLLEEHRNYLFLGFPGGRMVQSVIGEPLLFSGFLGAAEFGMGEDLTGMNSVVGNVLVITTERETKGLFGKTIADWEMKLVGEQTGGKLYSTQKIDTVYALDDLGVTSVSRTDAFGDFVGATLSKLVQPIVTQLRPNFTDSTIVRESNQFRMYFNDSSALVMYVPPSGRTDYKGEQLPAEFGFLSYPFPVEKIYNTEDETGKERTYFVSDGTDLGGVYDDEDFYVFEDQIGTSFDGALIESYVRLAFNHVGSPAMLKRFRRADLEINSNREQSLKFISDLSYGTPEISSGITDIQISDVPEVDIFGGGGFWDSSNWGEFNWDGQTIATARADLQGSGENIGFLIFNETAYSDPFILQGITLHYDPRRLQR
jgi:hypothetical protein